MKCSSSRLVAALVVTSVGETVALLPDETRLTAHFLHTTVEEHEETTSAWHEVQCISALEPHQPQRVRKAWKSASLISS
jgi:hypothetical protein